MALLQARAECRTTLGLIALSYFDAMECVTLADAAGTDVPIGRALALAGASHSTIDRKEGAAFLVRAENELARVGDEFGQLILASRRSTMAALGDPRVAGPVLEANRTAALRLGNPRQIFDWSMWAAMRSGILGDHATGRAAMELGLRVKPSSPDGQALLQCFDFMAAGPNKAGPTSDDLAKTHASLQRQEVGWMAVLVQTVRAHALIREGQYTEGRALADANLDILMVPGKNVLNIIISALCSIALGEFDRAEATYATIGDLASWTDSILGSAEVSAHLALHHNDPTAAEVSMRRALALATKQGYRRETIGALEMLAVIATRRGAWVDAARLIGAAEHHRDLWDLTAHLDPLATRLRASREAIDANLDADARAVALEAGAALTLEGVVEYVNRAHNERDRATVGWDALTPTERRVADLVRSGMSNAETAKELLMGAETVKTHLSRVFTKLGVANRTKLAALPPSPD